MTVIVSFSISGMFTEPAAMAFSPFKAFPAMTTAAVAADALRNSLRFISFIVDSPSKGCRTSVSPWASEVLYPETVFYHLLSGNDLMAVGFGSSTQVSPLEVKTTRRPG
jgi:hypothetical protein